MIPPAALAVAADDLTGAADVAGACSSAGMSAGVLLDNVSLDDPVVAGWNAVCIDTDGRAHRTAVAAAAVREAFGVLMAFRPDAQPMLKIDSTLRGHVAASIRAAVEAVRPERVIASPAFPQRRRTVRAGTLHVDGRPLVSRAWAQLVEELSLESCDVTTDGDLDSLVHRAHPGEVVLWVGSAGLAGALARQLRTTSEAKLIPSITSVPSPPADEGRIVVVVGSSNAVTAAQVRLLRDVELLRGSPHDREFVERAVRRTARASAVVVTGGATARVLLEALGVRQLHVGGECEPGIPWAVDPSTGRLFVTKSGSFGDRFSLVHAVDRLRDMMSA